MVIVREDLCTSYVTELFLEWKVFQTKVVEKVKTFFRKSCHYEIMRENEVEPDRPQTTV